MLAGTTTAHSRVAISWARAPMTERASPSSYLSNGGVSKLSAGWGTVAQRMASAFASSTDDEDYDGDSEGTRVSRHSQRLSERARARAERGVLPNSEVAHTVAPALATGGDGVFMDLPPVDWTIDCFSRPLTPSPVGAKLCPCQGEVLILFGHYGWLTTSFKIDHPATAWNGGRIYFHRRDVVGNMSLVEGDQVQFFLYVDAEGLGAEELSLQSWDATQRCAPVEMASGATEFVPGSHLIPSAPSMGGQKPVLDIVALNLANWSDDTGSDTDSSVACDIDQHGDLRRTKTKSRASSRGSASTGSPGDCDTCALDGPPPGLFPAFFRPPPGLDL